MAVIIHLDEITRWRDALARAKKSRIKLWFTRSGWRAHSKGSKDIHTLLAAEVAGGELIVTCSCEAMKFYGYCKHQIRLATYLHSKGETVRLKIEERAS